jgi:hypothetical protein
VLPECLDAGWTFPTAARLAQPIPGAHSDVLVRAPVTPPSMSWLDLRKG